MQENGVQQTRWPWTVYDFRTYITPGFVWFYVVCTGSVPLYVPWDPNPYAWAVLPLKLNWTTKRPFTRQGWGWRRGIWTMCRLVWIFRPSRYISATFNDQQTIRLFALPIPPLPQQIWFRFRVAGSAAWVNTSTPIFQLVIPTCPPPGSSGMTLIVGPPPPPIGDAFCDIILTFQVYNV